jgi:hypothetical protein
MQKASSTEHQNTYQKAVEALQEMKYPVTKKQLIEKAKSLNASSEVIKAFENIPDREYSSAADFFRQFEGIQKAVEAFRDIRYPATKKQLIEEAKKVNARSEVIKAFENIPDREYSNAVDVIKEVRGKSNW